MDAEKTTVIFGPPGTGKTTQLLRLFQELMDDGIQPEEVMFIAFTRKAAKEARDRVITDMSLHHDRVPWFRTLHSLAFELLGLNRRSVMGHNDYRAIAGPLGLVVSIGNSNFEGEIFNLTKGDRLFMTESLARATEVTLREYWEKYPNEDIYWYELERLQTCLNEYKKLHMKLDFTDMIQRILIEKLTVHGARALIVDEAQDLTPLQWRMVEQLAEGVERVYVAGDDDQAIFRWAGANVEHLINLPGERRILTQSYRVPSLIQHVAFGVASRINFRVDKAWHPREAAGRVEFHTNIEEIDMSKGSWLLLARNSYLLEDYVHHCMREGLIFETSKNDSVTRGEAYKAIVTYEKLMRGEPCLASDCKLMYDMASTRDRIKWGMKKVLDAVPDQHLLNIAVLRDKFGFIATGRWDEALDRLTPIERQYFLAAEQNGENFKSAARIKISTIHSVKGGEAEHVVIRPEMAGRTWGEFHENPDDEHRVWYVAVTRAKESLHILQPVIDMAYDI